METLRDVIWRERRKRMWSQRELGRRAGVNLQYLNRIETGRSNPTMAVVEAILKALGLRMTFEQEDGHGGDTGVNRDGATGAGGAAVLGVAVGGHAGKKEGRQ